MRAIFHWDGFIEMLIFFCPLYLSYNGHGNKFNFFDRNHRYSPLAKIFYHLEKWFIQYCQILNIVIASTTMTLLLSISYLTYRTWLLRLQLLLEYRRFHKAAYKSFLSFVYVVLLLFSLCNFWSYRHFESTLNFLIFLPIDVELFY